MAFRPVGSSPPPDERVAGQASLDLSEDVATRLREHILVPLREVRCGAIVGNHGTGKSTLLRELAGRLELEMPGGVWVQLTQSDHLREILSNVRTLTRCLRSVAPGGVIVIDGAEQIPAIIRRWIAWRCRRHQHYALVTSHHDIAGFQTLYRTALSPALIDGLVRELLPETDQIPPALRSHLQRHLQSVNLEEVSNLRDLWDDLYEVAESFERDHHPA